MIIMYVNNAKSYQMEEKSSSETGELTTPRSMSSQGEKDKSKKDKHHHDKEHKEKKHKEKKEKKEKKDKKGKKEDKPLPDVVPISEAQRTVSNLIV